MVEELDCFVADAPRNDRRAGLRRCCAPRNDGLGKNWIASELTLLAMTGGLDCFGADASRNDEWTGLRCIAFFGL